MGFSILVRWHLYIESGPKSWLHKLNIITFLWGLLKTIFMIREHYIRLICWWDLSQVWGCNFTAPISLWIFCKLDCGSISLSTQIKYFWVKHCILYIELILGNWCPGHPGGPSNNCNTSNPYFKDISLSSCSSMFWAFITLNAANCPCPNDYRHYEWLKHWNLLYLTIDNGNLKPRYSFLCDKKLQQIYILLPYYNMMLCWKKKQCRMLIWNKSTKTQNA